MIITPITKVELSPASISNTSGAPIMQLVWANPQLVEYLGMYILDDEGDEYLATAEQGQELGTYKFGPIIYRCPYRISNLKIREYISLWSLIPVANIRVSNQQTMPPENTVVVVKKLIREYKAKHDNENPI